MTDAPQHEEYGPGDPRQFVGIIPGGGWMIWRGDHSVPVVAWALQADSEVVALEADDDGRFFLYPVDAHHDERELWHPDSSSERTQLRLREYQDQLQRGGDQG
jgi:hypothetical protein